MNNIKFLLRTYKDDSRGVIWISFYVGRDKIHFSTKIEVERKNWSVKNERVGSGDRDAKDKNLILDNLYSRVTDVFVKC